jgi:hypothetical protein
LRETLLDVPRYDFGWQNSYELASPKRIPAGTRLVCTAVFDNSPENPNNPDPAATVRWGDQTWEEMMAGHFELVLDENGATGTTATTRRTDRFVEEWRQTPPEAAEAWLTELAAALRLDGAAGRLQEFAIALEDGVPQLDRVDVMAVRGDGLEIVLDAHPADRIPHLPGRGFRIRQSDLAIVGHARGGAPAVHDDLAQETAGDLKFMAAEFASSLHVPVTFDGQPASVNFWSQETGGFPPEAVEVLSRVAQLLIGP